MRIANKYNAHQDLQELNHVTLLKSLGIPLLTLLAVITITLLFVNKGSLQDAHWDAPIYLLRGKVAAETPLLRNYQTHAKEIADALPQYKPGVVDTPYWGFMRLGNTLLLGTVTAFTGASLASLQIASGLYALLLACSLVCGTLLAMRIIESLGNDIPKRAVLRGAVLSAILYLASDVYRYLSGNLVGEIPAMFLLTASALSLVEAIRSRRIAVAILSGVLGFALYVVKMELVWVYVSFALLYGAMLFRGAPTTMYWPAFVTSGLVALSFYGIYAWWFYPLADPRLFLTFAFADHEQPINPVAPIKLWIVAGGLLWFGFLLGFRYRLRHPVLWLSVAWLVAITLPHYDAILHGRSAQVRFFALIMPALLLGSTLGWASLFERVAANRTPKWVIPALLAGALVLIGLSQAETYQRLSHLPGGWRLQHVKAYLSPPPYERLSYPVEELAKMSRFLYQDPEPTIVVLEKGIPEEYANIIGYFGPRLPNVDQFDSASRSLGECGRKTLYPEVEPIMFCTVPPSTETLHSLSGKARVLVMQRSGGQDEANSPRQDRILFKTAGLMVLPWPTN